MAPQALPAQRGIALPLTALGFSLLLGFVALVVDVGRMLVLRTELQSAADACALAAVQELNQTGGQLARANGVGRFAAGRLGRPFQATPGAADERMVSVDFSQDGLRFETASASTAAYRFARCTVGHRGLTGLLATSLGMIPGGAMTTSAMATTTPSQTGCLLPTALEKPALSGNTRPYGMAPGRIYYVTDPLINLDAAGGIRGYTNYTLRLVDLSAAGSASTDTLLGQIATSICDVKLAQRSNLPAPLLVDQNQVDRAWPGWNARFGLYPDGSSAVPTVDSPGLGPLPDLTGWAPAPPQLAAASPGTLTHAAETGQFARYATEAGLRSATPDAARPIRYSTRPSATAHRVLGATGRRLAVMPVTGPASDGNAQRRDVLDYACVLLQRPGGTQVASTPAGLTIEYRLSVPVEFIGWANDVRSPCRGGGIPGGSSAWGPAAAVLVR